MIEGITETGTYRLYFARLWYSEDMYNITFVLNALYNYKSHQPRGKPRYE